MRLNFTYCAMLTTTVVWLAGCPGQDDGDSDPTPDSSSSSDSASMSVGDTGAVTEATDSGIDEPNDTEPDATGTTTTTGDMTTTATDGPVTATDTGGDDTGQAWPAECVEVDPDVSASYTLEVVGWPVEPAETGELDVPCSVDTVVAAADTVSTTLTCEIEGEPHAATLVIAASPDGPVSWAAGDPVKLTTDIWDGGDHGHGRNIQLRAADDALLLSATEAYIDEGFETRFAPLTVKLEYACVDPQSDFPETPLRMDITPPDGPVVGIFSGHRGVVPIDAEQQFAVDVEQAISTGIHLEDQMKVLLRRVNIGG